MGHKNYSKFSERFKKPENKEEVKTNNEIIEGQMTIEEVIAESNETMETVFEQVMDEIVDNKPEEKVVGFVSGCGKLNVRKKAEPDSTVLCIIDKGSEVVIDMNNSTEDYYKVYTSSNVVGYCVKKFISIK